MLTIFLSAKIQMSTVPYFVAIRFLFDKILANYEFNCIELFLPALNHKELSPLFPSTCVLPSRHNSG